MSGREAELAGRGVELAVAARSGAEVAVSVDRHEQALTRFANSVIHQNVAEDVTTVRVRLHHGGRTTTAAATIVGDDDLRALVDRVAAAVAIVPLDPAWPGLAPPAPAAAVAPPDPATADAAPAARADIVRAFVDGAGGLETAGFCRTDHWTGAFANSAGQAVSGEAAECGLSGIARGDGADGVARHAPRHLADLDGAALGARAAAKARAGRDPVELPPGRYEVVLEPTAVADVLESLATAGFNGKAVDERQSFVRVGDEQFDPSITLVDDPLAVGLGYDGEGTPRRRLVLVDAGRTVALTEDRRYAARAGAAGASTGHLVEGAFSFGPIARHLGLAVATSQASADVDGPAADASVAALVAGVTRGVLVSDFWYTRMLDPRTLVKTGLTRNGVWLIEDGEVTTPLRNFRFTQSYAQALMPGNVLGVGAAATPVPGDTYSATAPRWTGAALHLAAWNFTGGASG